MRVSAWGKRASYREIINKRVTREMEDRGQFVALVVFLLLWALSTPPPALSWLAGAVAALRSFHAGTVTIRRIQGLTEARARSERRRAFRRQMYALAVFITVGYMWAPVDWPTLVTGMVVTKVTLYFSAPRRSTWRISSTT